MTCGKTQEFLAKHKVLMATAVNARKRTLQEKDAMELIRDVDELYSAKGQKVVHLNLKTEKPDAAALKALLLGPTGNLRAPALRKGRTLLIGFDEATYKKILT